MIAILNWVAAHWFLIFLLAWLGVFSEIRDFFVSAVNAVTGTRHKRRMKELKLQAEIAAAQQAAPARPAPGRCVHRNVTPVISDDTVVAWLCKSCETDLPADWAVRAEDL